MSTKAKLERCRTEWNILNLYFIFSYEYNFRKVNHVYKECLMLRLSFLEIYLFAC